MHEFHGWIGLSESPEEADTGSLAARVAEVQAEVDRLQWSTASARVEDLNGQSFLFLNGLVNRVRQEAREAEALLARVARDLPGSWGLFYERADEFADPNAFRVRVLARGSWTARPDPFLSPCRPVIED